MSVVLLGSTSGSITLQEPAVAGTNTVNFGANTGVAILDANTPAFRNRIINGSMILDQRNSGASVSGTSGVYTLDRWKVQNNSGAARFNVQQNAGSVTPPAGFANYLGVTSTGAYSVAAGDVISMVQVIEGYNTADLAWGTASAFTVTMSFWVRSSLTGTFGGALKNAGASYSYPFTYTISSANTWEQKSITITGATASTWAATTSASIEIYFNMGTGSTFNGTAGAWASADYRSATGATSVVGTNGATFYITGVQLEKGSTATSFDYRPYGTELALCQRYYYAFASASLDFQFPICRSSTTASDITIAIPNSMRATPSIVGSPNYARIVGYDTSFGLATASCTAAVVGTSANLSQINVTFTNGSMAGTYVHCSLDTVSNNGFSLSAEL